MKMNVLKHDEENGNDDLNNPNAVLADTTSGGVGAAQGWVLDEKMRQMLMDLQRQWLADHQQSREKLLVELTEKLHQEFLADQVSARKYRVGQKNSPWQFSLGWLPILKFVKVPIFTPYLSSTATT